MTVTNNFIAQGILFRDDDERNAGIAFLEAQVYRLSEMLSVSEIFDC